MVPRTVRYPEKARAVVRRRERGNGTQLTSKAIPRWSIRPMMARKARESEENGSISKAEKSNLREKMR